MGFKTQAPHAAGESSGGQGLFGRLASHFKARTEQITLSYRDLVVRIADEQPPSDERALAILLEAEVSPEQLAADVERLKNRRALKEAYLAAEKAEADVKTMREQETQLSKEYDEALKAVHDRFVSEVKALRTNIVLTQQRANKSFHSQKMVDTAWPEQAKAMADLRRKHEQVLRAWQDAREMVDLTKGAPLHQSNFEALSQQLEAVMQEMEQLRFAMLTP